MLFPITNEITEIWDTPLYRVDTPQINTQSPTPPDTHKIIDYSSFKTGQIDYYDILCELESKGVLDKFVSKVKQLNGGTIYNQPLFNFVYTTFKLNPTMFD